LQKSPSVGGFAPRPTMASGTTPPIPSLPLRNLGYLTVTDYALCWLRIEPTYFFFKTATLGRRIQIQNHHNATWGPVGKTIE